MDDGALFALAKGVRGLHALSVPSCYMLTSEGLLAGSNTAENTDPTGNTAGNTHGNTCGDGEEGNGWGESLRMLDASRIPLLTDGCLTSVARAYPRLTHVSPKP